MPWRHAAGEYRGRPLRADEDFGEKHTVLIHDIDVTSQGSTATLTAHVRPDGAAESRELWYRFDGLDAPLDRVADALAVATLPFCMFEGEACRIEAPLSPALETNLSNAQSILTDWYDFLHRNRKSTRLNPSH